MSEVSRELTVEEYFDRFAILRKFQDSFGRQCMIASDNITLQRVIVKEYSAETQDQQFAVLENLDNHSKLSEFPGVCKFIAFTRKNDKQISAIFEYDQWSLQEYLQKQKLSQKLPIYIFLFLQGVNLINGLVSEGIELIDDFNLWNLLVYQQSQNNVKLKVFHDERLKAYEHILQGTKIYWSHDKIISQIRQGLDYPNIYGCQSIFQLGLILIDIIYDWEVIGAAKDQESGFQRDQPANTNILKWKSYYIVKEENIQFDYNLLNKKIEDIKINGSPLIQQLLTILVQMVESAQKRVSIEELVSETQIIQKIYQDSFKSINKKEQTKQQHQIINKQQTIETKQIAIERNQNTSNYEQLISQKSERQVISLEGISQLQGQARQNIQGTYQTAKQITSEFKQHKQQQIKQRRGSTQVALAAQQKKRQSIPEQAILDSLSCHHSIKAGIKDLIAHLQQNCNIVKKQYYDGSVYYGQVDALRHKRVGNGIYLYSQGDVYFGTWSENSLITGSYVFKNGQSFEGTVQNGKQNWGRYRYSNSNVYQGYWKDDLKQGQGVMEYPNGDKYSGNWERGKKSGQGTYYYSSGIVFTGLFQKGKKHGLGTIKFPNGTLIQAYWQQTHVQGIGRVKYSNGDYFEGNYHLSQKNGRGLYAWSNCKYQGDFKRDTLDGRAKITFSQEEYYQGQVHNGQRDGQGVYKYSNGDYYQGEWKNDQKVVGEYKFANGDIFNGRFKDNQINFGTIFYHGDEQHKGESYQGEFQGGYRHGVGTYRNKDKEITFEGNWNRDRFVKE